MPAPVIDLNADLGEEAGFDEALLGIVTSANVACGGHAGSEAVASATVRAAIKRRVVVGAHPGHADRAHFGRVALPDHGPRAHAAAHHPARPADGRRAGRGALPQAARRALPPGRRRPSTRRGHGARRQGRRPRLLGPPASVLLQTAFVAGVPAVAEGFVDRAYRLEASGPRLVPRGEPGALLGPEAAVRQAVLLATSGTVEGLGGAPVAVPVGSLCVHGDSPGAVEIAARVREALEHAGVEIRAFAA